MNTLRVVETRNTEEYLSVNDTSHPGNESASDENLVRSSIQEFCALHKEMHYLRENLVALGVPTQTLTILIEMGFHDRGKEQHQLMMSCLSEIGGGHVDETVKIKFQKQLNELTELEHDMAHARKIARESGLNLPALNSLTNMIRQNPGDGGEKMVNSFLAYAIAANIPLIGIDEILEKAKEKPKSVLPVIERTQVLDNRKQHIALVRDVVIGSVLATALLVLLT